jgi:hypothetical protein
MFVTGFDVALGMFVTGFDVALGMFSGFSTGLVYNAAPHTHSTGVSNQMFLRTAKTHSNIVLEFSLEQVRLVNVALSC